MKWNEVPDGVSLAMSKESAMAMRGSPKRPFIAGVICGVVLTISLQSCGSDDGKTDDTPKPSVSTTQQPKQ
jgi:NAD-dependent oxidoreductase involved in siderophore biosynthesis